MNNIYGIYIKLRYITILFSAVFSIAGTASAVEIYNKSGNTLDIYGNLSSRNWLLPHTDSSVLIYGLCNTTQIIDKLIGFGKFEYGLMSQPDGESTSVNPGKPTNLGFTNLGFVGIKYGNYGSIDYGRNYGVQHDVSSFTERLPVLGRSTSIPDNFLSNSANGVVTYRNQNCFGMLDGVSFALQYQNANDSKNLKLAHGNGYGLSVLSKLGNGLTAGVAYTNSKLTVAQNKLAGKGTEKYDKNKNATAYSLGMKYQDNNLYLGALYTQNDNMTPFGNFKKPLSHSNVYGFADAANTIKLVAQYQLYLGLRPSISYTSNYVNVNSEEGIVNKYIDIGATYSLNKNISTVVDYRINLQQQAPHIGLGMLYMF